MDCDDINGDTVSLRSNAVNKFPKSWSFYLFHYDLLCFIINTKTLSPLQKNTWPQNRIPFSHSRWQGLLKLLDFFSYLFPVMVSVYNNYLSSWGWLVWWKAWVLLFVLQLNSVKGSIQNLPSATRGQNNHYSTSSWRGYFLLNTSYGLLVT